MVPDLEYMQDFASRYTMAWCSHDPARVASFFSAEGSLTINDGVPSVGRDQIAEAARSFMESFPDLRVLMDDLVLREKRVEYHWTLIGTASGAMGKCVRISGYEAWHMGTDGLIAKSLGHFDAADYERQLRSGSQSR